MTFDPTTNRIMHGLLTKEERQSIETAKHGWQYWNPPDARWIDTQCRPGNDVWTYRAKPAPPVVTSMWWNVYALGVSDIPYSKREYVDYHAQPYRIAVLRIDTVSGVATAHIEPVEGGDA